MTDTHATPTATTEVLYNAECPVCSFEINHYRARTERQGLAIRFDDLNAGTAEWGLSQDAAAKRLHVRKDGQILAGMPAFRVLWADMPGYGWLARVAGWPILRPLSEFTYDRILAPAIYAWHKRRKRRGAVTR